MKKIFAFVFLTVSALSATSNNIQTASIPEEEDVQTTPSEAQPARTTEKVGTSWSKNVNLGIELESFMAIESVQNRQRENGTVVKDTASDGGVYTNITPWVRYSFGNFKLKLSQALVADYTDNGAKKANKIVDVKSPFATLYYITSSPNLKMTYGARWYHAVTRADRTNMKLGTFRGSAVANTAFKKWDVELADYLFITAVEERRSTDLFDNQMEAIPMYHLSDKVRAGTDYILNMNRLQNNQRKMEFVTDWRIAVLEYNPKPWARINAYPELILNHSRPGTSAAWNGDFNVYLTF